MAYSKTWRPQEKSTSFEEDYKDEEKEDFIGTTTSSQRETQNITRQKTKLREKRGTKRREREEKETVRQIYAIERGVEDSATTTEGNIEDIVEDEEDGQTGKTASIVCLCEQR